MNAAAVLEKLDELGVKVWVEGEKLHFQPASIVPRELLDEMKREKPVLLELVTKPVVYVAHVLCTSRHGVSVVERRPYSGDGRVSWEKVVRPHGEESVVEIAGPQTDDPFVVAGWLSLIAPEQVAQFKASWGLA